MTDAAPLGFHHIRLELAREPQHPDGDHDMGYDILAPLTAERRLDAAVWREAPEKCRVRRFSHGATLAFGRLRHAAPDRWFLDFEPGEADDAHGFRLADETIQTGIPQPFDRRPNPHLCGGAGRAGLSVRNIRRWRGTGR